MKDVILLLAGALLGGLVGLYFTVYYEERLKSLLVRRKRTRLTKVINRQERGADGAIVLAGHPTSVHIVEGDGQLVLEPENIRIRLSSQRTVLPPLVETSRHQMLRRLSRKNSRLGIAPAWNSDTLVSLCGYRLGRTDKRESVVMDLAVAPTDYATFAGTVLSLDEEIEATTLRRAYFPTRTSVAEAVRRPIPFLANGVGVLLLVFTDDGQVILSRRRPDAKARPNQHDVSVVEGIHSELDLLSNGTLDVFACAARGCAEELGIQVGRSEIHILGLIVDMDYYQWNFVGLVEAPFAASEIQELHSLHAKDRWESRLEPVPAEPTEVFRSLCRDGIWDSGLVAAYLALCYRGNPRQVRDAARVGLGSTPDPR